MGPTTAVAAISMCVRVIWRGAMYKSRVWLRVWEGGGGKQYKQINSNVIIVVQYSTTCTTPPPSPNRTRQSVVEKEYSEKLVCRHKRYVRCMARFAPDSHAMLVGRVGGGKHRRLILNS